jgi:flavin reductase (DIM6/NTAB) family NADH-FMN oxidoreductase RutF/DNA-binding MarR family transcriptional regulator
VDSGITVNSFTSLSLDPPLVLWCLARTSRTFAAFSECEYFAINILALDQVEVSNRFAFRSEEAFPGDVPFTRSAQGTPLLEGVCAQFQCRRYEVFDGGDHIVIVGEVIDFSASERPGLVYSGGAYAVAHPHPQIAAQAAKEPDAGFLETTVRPTLDELTRSFESLFDAELSAEGVSSRESQILGLLLSTNMLNTEEIANKALVSGAFLDEILQSLVDKKLIAEEWDCYSLTDKGRTQATGWLERVRAYRQQALGELSVTEAKELQSTIKRLSDWVDDAVRRKSP